MATLACLVCRRRFKTTGWLERHYESQHPGFLEEQERASKRRRIAYDDRDRDSPNPDSDRDAFYHETPVPFEPEFYNDDDPVSGNLLEGIPVRITRDGDLFTADSASNEVPESVEPATDLAAPTTSNTAGSTGRTEEVIKFSNAGSPVHYAPTIDELAYEHERELLYNGNGEAYLYHPFRDRQDYILAEWFLKHKVSQSAIDEMLKGECPLGELTKESLRSSHHFKEMVSEMESQDVPWTHVETDMRWNDHHPEPVTFWYRDPIEMAKWLLRQPCNAESLTYHPEKRYIDDVRQYSEMNTGKWWWREQEGLPDGGTLLPFIILSDGTHLTNFVGDKKAWPVYMTIGNLHSAVRGKPSKKAVRLIALLPIKFTHSTQSNGRSHMKQSAWNDEITHRVLRHIFRPLLRSERNSESYAFHFLCADGHYRAFYPRIASWLADFPEHVLLQNIQDKLCAWCEVPKCSMGDYPAQWPTRDHRRYSRLVADSSTEAVAELTARGVKPTLNILWWLPCNPAELPKPDVLHTMQLGMLKHLLDWLHDFLREHKRLALFNSIWKAVPSFLEMTRPKKAYEEISQWTGKEFKQMSRYLVGCVANSLRGASGSEHSTFKKVILCTRALIEFYLYCQYPVHDRHSLNSMEDSLKCFHDTKEVFLKYRAGKKGREAAARLRKTLIAERNKEVAVARGASVKTRIRDARNRDINSRVRDTLRQHAHFNFPKIHLMTHFRQSIVQFGSLEQHSTSHTEVAHKEQVKEGYNSSNKTGDFYKQILEYNLRQDCFVVRSLNLNSRNRVSNPESHSPSANTFDRPPHRLKSRQFKRGKDRIKTFGDLLMKVGDRNLQSHIIDSTTRYLRSMNVEIDEEYLLSAPAALYNSIRVNVLEYGTALWKPQTLRGTLEKPWKGGPPRRDWVWWRAVKESRTSRAQPTESNITLPWKALRGRLPARLVTIFKVSIIDNDDHRIPDQYLALVEPTRVLNGGAAEIDSGMVKVTKPSARDEFEVIHVSNIDSAAHLIPLDPDPATNTTWLVNSHIDIETWNEVFDDGHRDSENDEGDSLSDDDFDPENLSLELGVAEEDDESAE